MKVTAIGLAAVLAAYIGLSILGGTAIMGIPRLPLNASPASVGLFCEDISFASRDDRVVLKGWYIAGDGDLALVIVCGGFQNRVDNVVGTLDLAHDLVRKGYNLLLFDLRGRGESEGEGRSLSNIERDIGGAVDYLKNRGYQANAIGIIGFCSGAASSCIFASQEKVGALVLDGCFASVRGMVYRQATQRGIPRFLLNFFLPGLELVAKTMYGYDAVNPIDVVAEVPCPIFFIHEEYDYLISLEDNLQLYRASRNPANLLWEVRGAAHSQGYKTNPFEYTKRIHEFFTTAFYETPN